MCLIVVCCHIIIHQYSSITVTALMQHIFNHHFFVILPHTLLPPFLTQHSTQPSTVWSVKQHSEYSSCPPNWVPHIKSAPPHTTGHTHGQSRQYSPYGGFPSTKPAALESPYFPPKNVEKERYLHGQCSYAVQEASRRIFWYVTESIINTHAKKWLPCAMRNAFFSSVSLTNEICNWWFHSWQTDQQNIYSTDSAMRAYCI